MTEKLSERVDARYYEPPPDTVVWTWITEDDRLEIAALEQRVERLERGFVHALMVRPPGDVLTHDEAKRWVDTWIKSLAEEEA